jgi:hypothetical protein
MYLHSASSSKHRSADRHVASLRHIILIRSQAGFLRNSVYLAEKQQIPIVVFGLTRRILNPRYTALEESALAITSPMTFVMILIQIYINGPVC